MKIQSIRAREILNSRAEATIEVELKTKEGIFCSSVPSGVSVGKYEARQLPTQDAIKNLKRIVAPALEGKSFSGAGQIDEALLRIDGPKDKSKVGANGLLAVSLASFRAAAAGEGIPLYSYISKVFGKKFPSSRTLKTLKGCFNILEGGKHAGNNLDVQEFMIVPEGNSFRQRLWRAVSVFEALEKILEKEFGVSATNLGDEGGFAPPLQKTEQALDLVMMAIKKAGLERKVKIGLDVAASEFYKKARYEFEEQKRSVEDMVSFYQSIVQEYPILFIEDPFSQDDFKAWREISSRFAVQSSELLVVGDDLTATNPERMKEARKNKACNAVILKPNQIGTVTETLKAAELAKEFGWEIIVSHRGGDTTDDFIADLAVGVAAGFIKSGGPSRGERVAKYNRLLKIEEEL